MAKRSFQQILLYSFITLLGMGFLGFLVVSNIKIYQKRSKLKTQLNQLRQEIENLEQKNLKLKKGIAEIDDQQYLEKVARQKFLLKQKGEEVIVVTPPEKKEKKLRSEQKTFLEQILKRLNSLR